MSFAPRNYRQELILGVAGAAVVMVACSSNSGSPMSPSPTTAAATITVSATGVSPKEVRIGVGQRVRFVNNDAVNRQINSDPFPLHDDCPPINEVGLLTPGQSKMTGALTLEGACRFHEHLTEGAEEFFGTILVGNADADADPPIGY